MFLNKCVINILYKYSEQCVNDDLTVRNGAIVIGQDVSHQNQHWN